ncbi:HNH endonuclease signature motif containing protein [Brucella sp. 22210]|uniref:HNH endonuclease signature motif containing protein n=1 Tax=Brucella sp. 22210 TaxID=3453892 RepID=UPI003F832380
MTGIPRICACNNVVPHGELCACQRKQQQKRKAKHDRRRPTAAQRGYNHAWRKARAEFLAMHPYCVMPGCGKPASVVDHIQPHRGNKELFWWRGNWQPLCQPCHDSVKQKQERNQ